jgi:hypothetical protein
LYPGGISKLDLTPALLARLIEDARERIVRKIRPENVESGFHFWINQRLFQGGSKPFRPLGLAAKCFCQSAYEASIRFGGLNLDADKAASKGAAPVRRRSFPLGRGRHGHSSNSELFRLYHRQLVNAIRILCSDVATRVEWRIAKTAA